MLGRMDPDRYRGLKSRVLGRNPRTWSYDRSDCAAFVEKLRGLAAMPSTFVREAAA
jgi:succinoglycan biosynthesis protein ExoL